MTTAMSPAMTPALSDLIDHDSRIEVDATLGDAFRVFTHHEHEFMAVLDGNRVVGLCSRQDLGMLLGPEYGFPLFAQKPLREHLRPNPIYLAADSDIREAFERVFAREAENFFDDVLILGPDGIFLGLISTQTLVKLQNQFHRESIRLLKEQGDELSLKNRQIEADLHLSRELQQSLLPDVYPRFPPTAAPGESAIQFHCIYRSVGIVGGDFYHVQPIANDLAGVFIADVMGHGVRAALVSAMLRALLEELGPLHADPGELLTRLNQELVRILNRGSREVVYVTALYLTLDTSRQRLRIAAAGHPSALRLRRKTRSTTVLEPPGTGTVLGLLAEEVYVAAEWPLEPGDTLLLMTDGLLEVQNAAGEDFALTRLLPHLEALMPYPSDALLAHLEAAALEHAANHHFTDDMCLLAIDFPGVPPRQAVAAAGAG
jgi:sigma-B regulation protein RsbU (phosphoserine phosphatase)